MKPSVSIATLLALCSVIYGLQPLGMSYAASKEKQPPGPTQPIPPPLPDIRPMKLYFDKPCNLMARSRTREPVKLTRMYTSRSI